VTDRLEVSGESVGVRDEVMISEFVHLESE
jgi:hypothetical protein